MKQEEFEKLKEQAALVEDWFVSNNEWIEDAKSRCEKARMALHEIKQELKECDKADERWPLLVYLKVSLFNQYQWERHEVTRRVNGYCFETSRYHLQEVFKRLFVGKELPDSCLPYYKKFEEFFEWCR